MIVATLRSDNPLGDAQLMYDEASGAFSLQDVGGITAGKVLDLENRQQLVWDGDGTRDWVLEIARGMLRAERPVSRTAGLEGAPSSWAGSSDVVPPPEAAAKAARRAIPDRPAGVPPTPTRFELQEAPGRSGGRVVWTDHAAGGRSPGPATASKTRGPGFARDILKLASGTTVAQLLVFATAPVLTRLYGPSQFGAYALFAGVSGILIIAACLRYEFAIVLPESHDEGAALLWGSLAIAGFVGAAVLLLSYAIPSAALARVGAGQIWAYRPLLALATALGGAFNALNYWHTRTHRYGLLAGARIANTTVTAAVQLGGGYLAGFGNATGLVGGSLAGNWVATLALAARATAGDWRILSRNLRLRMIAPQLKRHWRFPVYNSWAALMNSISWQLPALMLGAYFSERVVGYYALGWRVLALPMSLVGMAIGQVFFQRAAAVRDNGRLPGLVRGVFSVLVDVGLVPFLVLTLAGKDIFEFAFGLRWAEAGVYVQILSIYTFVWFISSPLSNLYLVLDQQRRALWLNGVILLSRFGSLAIGGWFPDARLGLAIFAVSGIVAYGYMNQYIMAQSAVTLRDTWRVVRRASINALVPCGIVLGGLVAGLGDKWVFALSVVAVAISTVHAAARWRHLSTGREVQPGADPAGGSIRA